jgi:hypothetical protein
MLSVLGHCLPVFVDYFSLCDCLSVQARDTIQALKDVANEIEKLKTPTGEKDAPGMTCRDIAMTDSSLKNGTSGC